MLVLNVSECSLQSEMDENMCVHTLYNYALERRRLAVVRIGLPICS